MTGDTVSLPAMPTRRVYPDRALRTLAKGRVLDRETLIRQREAPHAARFERYVDELDFTGETYSINDIRAQYTREATRRNAHLEGYGGVGRKTLRTTARAMAHTEAVAHREDVEAGVTDDVVACVDRYVRGECARGPQTTTALAAWFSSGWWTYSRVLRALRSLARRGVVVEEERPGKPSVWRLA